MYSYLFIIIISVIILSSIYSFTLSNGVKKFGYTINHQIKTKIGNPFLY